MEMRCYHKIVCISYKDHVTNEEVCGKIQQAIRPDKDLLTIVKRYKLKWYRHVVNHLARHSERQKKTRQTEKETGRQQGMDRPGVYQVPEDSEEQRRMEKTGFEVICSAPITPIVKG